MKIHIVILAIALLLGKSYDLDISLYYQKTISFISSHSFLLNVGALFLILLMLVSAVLFNSSTVLSMLRILDKAVMEASRFIISLLSFGSLYYAAWWDRNIWPDFLPILALPVLGVLASALCINIIDFNQPVKPGVVNSLLLGVASFVIVNLVLI